MATKKKKTARKVSRKQEAKAVKTAIGKIATQPKGHKAKADSGDGAALVTVGVGQRSTAKTVINAQELASRLGVSGKRLRGWLRGAEQCGNDGRYSHYAIDTGSKEGKALIAAATAKFVR